MKPTFAAAAVCWMMLVLVAIAPAQERTMGLMFRDSGAAAGCTLFAPILYHVSYLIDTEGRLIQSWPSSYTPGFSAYLLEDGSLLRAANLHNPQFPQGGAGGRVGQIDWDGDVVWAYQYSTDLHCQHRDATMLPTGNVLMIAWKYKTRLEAIAAGRNPEPVQSNALWPAHLVEVDPSTDSTYGPDSMFWSYGGPGGFHTNYMSGCQRMISGNTLVSLGPPGTIFEVTPDKRVVWKYINPVCDTGPMVQYQRIPIAANALFRAVRYSPDYSAFAGRSLVPRGPIERYPGALAEPTVSADDHPGRLSISPNPTDASAVVRFFMPSPGNITLSVYNAAG